MAQGTALAGADAYNGVQSAKDLYNTIKHDFEGKVPTKGTDEANKVEKPTNKLKLENFTKEVMETKPKNSPLPENWYKKGGNISIDGKGTWTYTNKSGTSVRYPKGYTWHHHEDGETMMLVDKFIHKEFTHIGGQSKINGK